MKPGDAARVLATCHIYDHRFGEPNEVECAFWYQALNDIDVDDAVQAVIRHYQTETDRIMPGHIRRGVAAIRQERRRQQPTPPRQLPSRFETSMARHHTATRGAATVQQALAAVLDGLAETSPPPRDLPPALTQLRELTAHPTDCPDGDVVEGELLP